MTEQWWPIPGFPGYEASSDGRVRSLVRGKWRVVRGWLATGGYLRTSIPAEDGVVRSVALHRLVASAFHGPCPEGMECRHLNGVPNDNRPENLRWGTKSENQLDKRLHGTHHLGSKKSCPKGHPYDEANTLYRGGDKHRRLCRKCNRAAARRWYYARKEEAAAMKRGDVA